MNSRIQIKTGEPEAQLLPGVGTNWMSKMYLVINGNEQFLGNIYHTEKLELTNLCSYFEAVPMAFANIQKFNQLDKEVQMGIKDVTEVHETMRELFQEVENSL